MLQNKVFQHSPQEAGLSVPVLNLLLLGGVGAGKSSIVSTIDSICKGRISRRAAHGEGAGSLTKDLHKFNFVQPGSKQPVKWQIWDSMGWGSDDYKQGELGFILDGNLPSNTDLTRSISTRTAGFNAHPRLQDRVHCMILVVPAHAATDEGYLKRLQEMRQIARDRGELRNVPSLSCVSLLRAECSCTLHCIALHDHADSKA